MNIIENSRKGAATDSAYGYKDAISKAYLQELSKPNQDSLKLNGTYEVQSDGTLIPATGSTFGIANYTLPVSVSGDKPSSGTLTYSNNVLTSGCLVIGDYAVTFDGNTTSTLKGTCSSNQDGNNGQGGNGGNNGNTQYTVTFNYNNGNNSTSETVNSGSTISKPSNPINGEYIFGGWFTDESLTTPFNFSTSITGNTNLYAKYLSKFRQYSYSEDWTVDFSTIDPNWTVWLQDVVSPDIEEVCVLIGSTPICIAMENYDCNLVGHTCTENGYIMKKINESIQAGATCELFPIIDEDTEEERIYEAIFCSLNNTFWKIYYNDVDSTVRLSVYDSNNTTDETPDFAGACSRMDDMSEGDCSKWPSPEDYELIP